MAGRIGIKHKGGVTVYYETEKIPKEKRSRIVAMLDTLMFGSGADAGSQRDIIAEPDAVVIDLTHVDEGDRPRVLAHVRVLAGGAGADLLNSVVAALETETPGG
jgi:hypothetical protein